MATARFSLFLAILVSFSVAPAQGLLADVNTVPASNPSWRSGSSATFPFSVLPPDAMALVWPQTRLCGALTNVA